MPFSPLMKLRHAEALEAVRSLTAAGHQAMLAGGCVRDRIMQRDPNDFDIATDATPDIVTRHFTVQGLRVIPTGVEHGTVTLLLRSGPVEITTLRRDVRTDGRRAEVKFGGSFAEDAARRDFTINAMFEDQAGKVHDFFGGTEDIRLGRLRFVGDPSVRIREDFLRIMRLFRFWSRFGFAPDSTTLQAVAALVPGLTQISQERITAELQGILAGDFVVPALQAMCAAGVLQAVLPELQLSCTQLPGAEPFRMLSITATGEWVACARLALLLQWCSPVSGEYLMKIGVRLRLPTQRSKSLAVQARIIGQAVSLPTRPSGLLDLIDQLEAPTGAGGFVRLHVPVFQALAEWSCRPDRAALQDLLARLSEAESRAGHLRTAVLPVSGHDVRALVQPASDREIGSVMAGLRAAYRNGEWFTREQGLAWLAQKFPKSSS